MPRPPQMPMPVLIGAIVLWAVAVVVMAAIGLMPVLEYLVR